jgi:ferredoxin
MPTLIINGKTYHCKRGERLLTVARRHAAHIGFVCYGLGFCQTCGCRIVQGNELLNPITSNERKWLDASRLTDDYRLACQTIVRGEGTIEIISRAEELRMQTMAILSPSGDSSIRDNAGLLANSVGDLISHLPSNAMVAASYIGKVRPNWHSIQNVIRDAGRVALHMSGREDMDNLLPAIDDNSSMNNTPNNE